MLRLRALGCCREMVEEDEVLGRTKAWVLAQPASRQATATTLLRMMMPVSVAGGREGKSCECTRL